MDVKTHSGQCITPTELVSLWDGLLPGGVVEYFATSGGSLCGDRMTSKVLDAVAEITQRLADSGFGLLYQRRNETRHLVYCIRKKHPVPLKPGRCK